MHELSIAGNLMEVIREASNREKFSQVKVITLKIGEMTMVDKHALSFCFEIVSKDTCAEGALLKFEMIPLTAKCSTCGATFHVEEYVFRCGCCGSVDVDLVSGREIRIAHIDVKDGEEGCTK